MDNEQELLDFIWNEQRPENTSHYSDAKASFFRRLTILSTGEIAAEKDINAITTEYQLIKFFRPSFKWNSIPTEILRRFSKSTKMSIQLRERANNFYKLGNVSNALRGYNLALVFAPPDSQELGLAYGNRSSVYVQLMKWDLAIRDIDLAFEHNFPETLRSRLVQRRQKCDEAIAKEIKTKDKNGSNEKDDDFHFCTEKFFTLKSPNKNNPRAEDFVEIDFHVGHGRRLVVTKNVNAGTLLLIDKPFVAVLNNLLIWDTQHCHYCYCTLDQHSGIPCRNCTFTFYCNDICRQQSNEGNHKHEHNYLPYLWGLPSSEITHRDLQTLRLLSTIAPEELLKMYQSFTKSETLISSSSTRQIAGFDENNLYNCNSYNTMYNLISHVMQSSAKEKLDIAFKAFVLAHVMKSCSNFFQNITNCVDMHDFEDFITSIIFRHLGNIRYNAISVSELQQSELGEVSVAYATAVYPLISLCNHSCDPNTVALKRSKFLETSLVTLKNLKIGDEIFITYKPLFTNFKTRDRLNYLKENYNFMCKCNACENDLHPKSMNDDLILCKRPATANSDCIHCKSKMSNNTRICESCLRKLFTGVDDFESKLYKADDLIKENNYKSATLILKDCLEYFSEHFVSQYSLSQVSQDLYKRALVRLVNSTHNNKQM